MRSVDSTETPFTRDMFMRAVQVTRESDDPLERKQAAFTAHMLTHFQLALDERCVTEVMNVLAARLAESEVVDHLASALRGRAPALEKLAPGIARLAARAHQEQLRDSLRHLVILMLAVPEWEGRVHEQWANAVIVRFASEAWGRRLCQCVILEWLRIHRCLPDSIRETVETHTQILATCFEPSGYWKIHCAVPTVHGWRLLAGPCNQHEQMLDPKAFGEHLDVAVETLEAAISTEPNEGARVALARWLSEVAG